ncbi:MULTISPECIES: hypothetical protein [Methylorubrum]|nr:MULTISPECIES: hypothetical protein [Methylorubrum]MCP1542138.1 hypothetical protein [Methylorubrum extorquens]MCP1590517.1 hypothetical protein [Methylorubrum extorquens]
MFDILPEMKKSMKADRIMKQVIGIALALLTITGPAWAGPETETSSHPKGHAAQATQEQRVAETTKKDTQRTRDTGAPESRPGYHGDTSSKHGNAKFPERPESQHGHGETPGGPQH